MVVCSSLDINGNNSGCCGWLRWQYRQLAEAILSVTQKDINVQQNTEGSLHTPPSLPLSIIHVSEIGGQKWKLQDYQGSQYLTGEDYREKRIAEKGTSRSSAFLKPFTDFQAELKNTSKKQ